MNEEHQHKGRHLQQAVLRNISPTGTTSPFYTFVRPYTSVDLKPVRSGSSCIGRCSSRGAAAVAAAALAAAAVLKAWA